MSPWVQRPVIDGKSRLLFFYVFRYLQDALMNFSADCLTFLCSKHLFQIARIEGRHEILDLIWNVLKYFPDLKG
jgi:hypothetical protein